MTFDFQRLQNDVSDCLNCLRDIQSRLDVQPVATTPENEPPINVKQTAEFLHLAEQTVYQRIKEIPHKKRFGKLYFYPSELRAYLDNGKA